MKTKASAVVERLAPDECWDLLDQTNVGRLAVLVDGHPDIFPVNYVLDGDSIVFRTGAGTKFWSTLTTPCAVEIDGYKALSGKAWSVVVRGRTHLILDRQERADVDALGLDPWQPGSKNCYLRLTPEAITGRRFKTKRPDLWATPLNDARTDVFH
ncbi:pyridoxamine 5'-phosphate oxidase family protein [Paenarthrobacter nitroguajacolicus]|uniref:pyridoxamine 5'-phosphate oxidase family protein n=1 Tax=Paenarthrobacter nitroguajacolicus TaxID=211146 RepID=UPI0028655598|nr:pyridoxamine 5'-phosphate oxidase family protein [Paenarthrobacter nitroguajacolicus]MDR6636877.1 nitroimidazol reductase NimA-like FMN-containing flavoprotein (pyridoxamine 5'-phosphate oxidase superfamily) [Paenarthrobacter nitroguajacolicus]